MENRERTIGRANEIVTEFAEGKMKRASQKIDFAARRRKGLTPQEAKDIVYEYNEWLEFVRPKRSEDSFYLVRVRNGMAKIIPSDE